MNINLKKKRNIPVVSVIQVLTIITNDKID